MPISVIVAIVAVGALLHWIIRSEPYECPECGAFMRRADYCHRCGWSTHSMRD